MTEHGIIFLAFLALYILLMIVNYMAYAKYPENLTEGALGGGLLESKGPAWFVLVKMSIALVIICFVFIPISMFLPTRYSYLLWGILLGSVSFNLFKDCLTYRKVARMSEKR
jgi:uncharacterized BrkB/YihY/UPF0761 family membrane protein